MARVIGLLLTLLLLHVAVAHAQTAPEVWFAPANDTADMRDLFRRPDLWPQARSHISVFKLGPQQVGGVNQTGANTLASLHDVDAFRIMKSWGMKLAIEVPAIKPWDCSGIKTIDRTAYFIRSVRAAGGTVDYISMDEPLLSGLRHCKDTLETAAAKTAHYITEMRRREPGVSVGDIVAYPFNGVDEIIRWVAALNAAGAKPTHLHIDINGSYLDVHPEVDAIKDLSAIKNYLTTVGIRFGIIVWSGINPMRTDEDYFNRTMARTRDINTLLGPRDQVIFQSWVIKSPPRCVDNDPSCSLAALKCGPDDPPACGHVAVPTNLPENDPKAFSHTRLLNEALRLLAK